MKLKIILKQYFSRNRFIWNFAAFLLITVGLFIGVELAKMFKISTANFKHKIEPSADLKNITNILREKVRVLCYVLTRDREYSLKASHIRQTWGKHCNKLLFMTTKKDENLDSVVLDIHEGPFHLWPKTLVSMGYLYENHLNDFDWFLKADADAFIIIENLQYFLYSYSPEQALYFSYHLEKHVLDPGYILSRGALRRYGEKTRLDKLICPVSPVLDEEYAEITYCFVALQIHMSGAIDFKRCRSFPSTSCFFYETFTNRRSKKFEVFTTETKCCPEQILSFSDVSSTTMNWLNYIIYRVQVYGINRPIDPLPNQLFLRNL